MIFSKDKAIQAVCKSLVASGEWFVKSTKRHVRLENSRTHQAITVPRTPSDCRAAQNWIHQQRRNGVIKHA